MSFTRVAGFVIGCAVLGVASVASAAPRQGHAINARQHRQAQRIHQGVKSGDITPAENDKLKADEAAVRAEERVYRRSGDGLNTQERHDLEKDLNKTSREIYRATHNDKTTK
jgi:hypothetical protein